MSLNETTTKIQQSDMQLNTVTARRKLTIYVYILNQHVGNHCQFFTLEVKNDCHSSAVIRRLYTSFHNCHLPLISSRESYMKFVCDVSLTKRLRIQRAPHPICCQRPMEIFRYIPLILPAEIPRKRFSRNNASRKTVPWNLRLNAWTRRPMY